MLTSLPDSVLLTIFQYLDVRHLSRLSRVCKRFWKLTNDRTLWKKVDLSSFCINLQRLSKLMHVRFPNTLQSLKVRGYAKVFTPKWKTETVSPSLLADLAQRCPSLHTLDLIEVYFSERTTVSHLPPTVVTLTLTRCNFASYAAWFSESNLLTGLKMLDLSQCPSITQKALNNVFRWHTVEGLVLQNCHTVNDAVIKALSKSELKLRVLNLRGTYITNEAVVSVTMHMPSMEEFYFGGVPGNHMLPDRNTDIDNRALEVFHRLNNLQVLVASNTDINDDGLKFLHNNKKIQFLDVSETSVTALACENFRAIFPQCLVKL